MKEQHLLIVNALDFGRTPSVNEAIVRASTRGIVTSASLMVFGAAAEDAARRLTELDSLAVGLHVDLGEWVQRGEVWLTLYERCDLSSADAVAAELVRQLECFRALVGRDPTHIDSHQHVHRRPVVARAMRTFAKQLGVPLHDGAVELTFAGIVHRTDEPGFASETDAARLTELIDALPPGPVVLDCHPDLATGQHSPCCMEHPTSLAVLCDPAVRAHIVAERVALISYDDYNRRHSRFAERLAAGRAAFDAARTEEALALFDEALALLPTDPDGWLAKAQAKSALGLHEHAIASARRALEVRPNWIPALWQLVGYLWRAERRAEVIATVDELCAATRLDSRAGTHSRIVLHALRAGCSRDVITSLLDARMDFTDDELSAPMPPMELGRLAYQRGDFDLAEGIFKGIETADGVRPWTALWLSRTYQATGRTDEAFAAIARGIAVTDDRRLLGVELADQLARKGARVEAIAVLEGLHERNPTDCELASTAARRLIDLGAQENALRLVEKALAIAWSPSCAITCAAALWHLGDATEAERLIAEEAATLSDGERSELALLIERPLDAWRSLRTSASENANGTLVWRTAHALRRNGHLRAAHDAFRASAEGETRAAEEWAARTSGEIELLSGRWRAPVLRHPGFTPIDGRVLNIVGKSLPHAQSGYTIRTHSEARVQLQMGLEPHVVTQLGFPWTVGVDAAPAHQVIDGVEYHRLLPDEPIPQRLDELTSANTVHLADLIARLRPSVLHAASDFRNPLMAAAAARHFGLPLIYTVRGFWQETWLSKHSADALESDAYRWRSERELDCMHAATHVVTIAETMKALMIESGVPAEKITVVPNAVDTDDFHPVQRNDGLASRLGIVAGESVLGYISSFTGYEGIGYLIDAAALLIERGHPLRVLLVGDGEDRARLEARAQERGIAERVIFTGRVPHSEVLDYYGIIDIFVVPRTADRVCQLVTPLKPYEAMATERAVVVSGVPALREMIVEGSTGLSFRPEDSQDLARVVEPLLGDADRRRELGRAARAWVVANRTWRANGARLQAVLESLTTAPPVS